MDFQNFKYYKDLLDVDYLSYFTKSYFAFNAYLQSKFNSGKDRDKIDKIKEDITSKNRFIELLSDEIFKNKLIEFKNKLMQVEIKNDDVIVSFKRVKIQSFSPKGLEIFSYKKISYDLKIIGGKTEKVRFVCIDSNDVKKCDEECEYLKLDETLNNTDLSRVQREKIKGVFSEEISSYHKDLTAIVDNFSGDDDKELIYKGFIEIIYALRNALFHNHIEPTKNDVRYVYKLSYELLKNFINKLPTDD